MKSQLPRVSIIIPTYNMRQWITEALDSALAQTYPHCEIIVVDDGSTDGTGDFIHEKYGDQIRYVYQENKGRGGARNTGLRMANGRYIQFLDADDFLASHKIQIHVEFLEQNPRYAAAYGRPLVFLDGNLSQAWEYQTVEFFTSGNLLRPMIETGGLFQVLPVLVRREWIERVGGFDEQMRRCEEYDLWLRLARAGALFSYLPGEPVGFYRKFPGRRVGTGGEITPTSAGPGSEIAHTSSVLYALNKLSETLSAQEYHDLGMPRAIAHAQFAYGRALLLYKRRWEGVVALLRSLRASDMGTKFQAMAYLVLGIWLPYHWIENRLGTFMKWQYHLKRDIGRKLPILLRSRWST